jgi:hypothetical protein
LSGGRQLQGDRRAPSSHTRKKVKLSDHGEAGIPEGYEPLVDPDISDSEFRDEPLISNEADSSVCSEYIQFKRTRRSAKNKRSTGMENNLQGEVNPLNEYRISAFNEKILFEQSETEKNTWEANLQEVITSRQAKDLPLHRPPQNRWRLVGNRYIQLSKSQLNRVLFETRQHGQVGAARIYQSIYEKRINKEVLTMHAEGKLEAKARVDASYAFLRTLDIAVQSWEPPDFNTLDWSPVRDISFNNTGGDQQIVEPEFDIGDQQIVEPEVDITEISQANGVVPMAASSATDDDAAIFLPPGTTDAINKYLVSPEELEALRAKREQESIIKRRDWFTARDAQIELNRKKGKKQNYKVKPDHWVQRSNGVYKYLQTLEWKIYKSNRYGPLRVPPPAPDDSSSSSDDELALEPDYAHVSMEIANNPYYLPLVDEFHGDNKAKRTAAFHSCRSSLKEDREIRRIAASLQKHVSGSEGDPLIIDQDSPPAQRWGDTLSRKQSSGYDSDVSFRDSDSSYERKYRAAVKRHCPDPTDFQIACFGPGPLTETQISVANFIFGQGFRTTDELAGLSQELLLSQLQLSNIRVTLAVIANVKILKNKFPCPSEEPLSTVNFVGQPLSTVNFVGQTARSLKQRKPDPIDKKVKKPQPVKGAKKICLFHLLHLAGAVTKSGEPFTCHSSDKGVVCPMEHLPEGTDFKSSEIALRVDAIQKMDSLVAILKKTIGSS